MARGKGLTHIDEFGKATMVDVSSKSETLRIAVVKGKISMNKEAYRAVKEGTLKKGEALSVARVSGIMAAKKTSDLIPLTHPLRITRIDVDFSFEDKDCVIEVEAAVKAREATGVEMEAMTAASVALLTIYDMAKALDRSMKISDIRLVYKTGGKSGEFLRKGEEIDVSRY